jgi:ribosomal protein L20A (L18A)
MKFEIVCSVETQNKQAILMVDANSKKHAIETALSMIGARNGISRGKIRISEIREVK